MPAAPAAHDPVPGASPVAHDDKLHDVLWEVTAYTELLGEAALADTPLTLPSSGMLIRVLSEPGITVAEVARRIPKTPQAISQVVARLEKHGLLERRLGSGRGVGLFVTPAGREVAEACREREDEHDAHLRELLGSDRFEQLRQLLLDCRTLLRKAH